MSCVNCVHVREHGPIKVCRESSVLAWQERALGCRIGVHSDIAREDARLCGGKLEQRRAA